MGKGGIRISTKTTKRRKYYISKRKRRGESLGKVSFWPEVSDGTKVRKSERP